MFDEIKYEKGQCKSYLQKYYISFNDISCTLNELFFRKSRQDTGYSTSSSRNSHKHDKLHKREGKKKASRREETRRSASDERHKRRGDRKSSEKKERKSTKTKNDDDSDKSSNRKFDSENEFSSEELTESKIISEGSESECDKKR